MAIEEFNGKLVEEKKSALGTMPGKEYLIKTRKGMIRFGLFGTGSQIFRIAVAGTKEQVESKDTEIFFNSLKRTSKIKPKKDK
jgi:hypothetical protein